MKNLLKLMLVALATIFVNDAFASRALPAKFRSQKAAELTAWEDKLNAQRTVTADDFQKTFDKFYQKTGQPITVLELLNNLFVRLSSAEQTKVKNFLAKHNITPEKLRASYDRMIANYRKRNPAVAAAAAPAAAEKEEADLALSAAPVPPIPASLEQQREYLPLPVAASAAPVAGAVYGPAGKEAGEPLSPAPSAAAVAEDAPPAYVEPTSEEAAEVYRKMQAVGAGSGAGAAAGYRGKRPSSIRTSASAPATAQDFPATSSVTIHQDGTPVQPTAAEPTSADIG